MSLFKYRCLPKKRHLKKNLQGDVGLKKATLSQYFLMENCIVCNEITSSSVCMKCQGSTQLLCTTFLNKIGAYERRNNILMQVCGSCSGRTVENDCISLDCPIFYSRIQAVKDFHDVPSLRKILDDNVPC